MLRCCRCSPSIWVAHEVHQRYCLLQCLKTLRRCLRSGRCVSVMSCGNCVAARTTKPKPRKLLAKVVVVSCIPWTKGSRLAPHIRTWPHSYGTVSSRTISNRWGQSSLGTIQSACPPSHATAIVSPPAAVHLSNSILMQSAVRLQIRQSTVADV